MTRTPLTTLRRLRQLDLDEAQTLLARAIEREASANRTVVEAEDSIVREQEFALRPEADDGIVEAFGRWLPLARGTIERARRQLDQAVVEAGIAHAAFLKARAALKAVEHIIEKQEEERRQIDERRQQQSIEEAWRPRDGDPGRF